MTEPADDTSGVLLTGLRRWEKISDELPFTQLERLRNSADKWLTTISALTGLTGLLTLLSSQAKLTALNSYGEWGVGAILALAFVSALVAIFQGALAAQGKSANLLNDPLQVRNWYRTETHDAAKALRISRWSALIAAVLAGTALFLTWYGPRDRTAELTFSAQVVLKDGDKVCDRLSLTENRIVLPMDEVQDLNVTDVKMIKVIDQCP